MESSRVTSRIPFLAYVCVMAACVHAVPAPAPPPPVAAAAKVPAHAPSFNERLHDIHTERENFARALEALETQGQYLTDPTALARTVEEPGGRARAAVDVQALSAFARDVLALSEGIIVRLRALPASPERRVFLEELRPLVLRLRFAIAAIDESAETLGLPRTVPQAPRSLLPI